jgi:hypothetical protein
MARETSSNKSGTAVVAAGAPRPVVAFVCTHNACRSQMAQALAEHMMSGEATFLSAGTDPAPMSTQALWRSFRAGGFRRKPSQHCAPCTYPNCPNTWTGW